LRTLRSISVQE
nr:immunoglobulin heavy chain junction region [Mus musculus]